MKNHTALTAFACRLVSDMVNPTHYCVTVGTSNHLTFPFTADGRDAKAAIQTAYDMGIDKAMSRVSALLLNVARGHGG